MRKLLMSMAVAAVLAAGAIVVDGAAHPTFASAGVCAGGPGPLCRVERTCLDYDWEIGWPLRVSRTCSSWREETFYWTYEGDGGDDGGGDPALPPGDPESPETPEEG
ncbi:MAG TPA: hypothetical protein VK837_13200 [Longimicrobiales bacterium]|nr:hypothetical protein [Longimicrobiales bacterium]